MIGNLIAKGPDTKTHRYPHRPPRPQNRPQPPRGAPRPYGNSGGSRGQSSLFGGLRGKNGPPRPPRRSPKYPLKLPIVQDLTGRPYPPQPNGATFSFQPKPQGNKRPSSISKVFQGGFLPSAPYWKTYDNLYVPPPTTTTTPKPNFYPPPTSLIAPGVQGLTIPEFTTEKNPFLRLQQPNLNPSIPNSIPNLSTTTEVVTTPTSQDVTTNFNPLNFNHQLNVASLLSHLDDEDIEAIEAELSDVKTSNNPNLQEWFNTLEQTKTNRSLSQLKRQILPNQFQLLVKNPSTFGKF